MVGIAGKSKACQACRKRRVACGFERPHCVRCQKAGIECPGYKRRPLFVNRTVANPSTTAQDVIGTSGDNDDEAFQDVVDEYHSMSRALASSSYSFRDFRISALRVLRRLYLPRKSVTDESLAVGASSWVAAVCACEQSSSTLDHALLALCAAQLYITQHGDLTLDRALDVYSGGLSRLATCLQHVDTDNLGSLLGSIVVLSTCELFICPLNSGWRAHVQGMAELLRFRVDFHLQGPSSDSWAGLCARARLVSVLTGLMTQTRSIITPAQWRTVMPGRPQDDPLDDLLDLISDLPTLLETISATAVADAVASMLRTLSQVYTWERLFRRRTTSIPYSYVNSRLSNPADDGHDEPLYPLVLEFPALQIASCLIICWGVMLQSWAAIVKRLREEANNESTPRLLQPVWDILDQKLFKYTPPQTAIIVEAKRRAGLLCQCVEFTHREDMGSLGPQTMTYARGVLLRFFTEHDMKRELAWCQNIPHMTNHRGEKFAVQLFDFRI